MKDNYNMNSICYIWTSTLCILVQLSHLPPPHTHTQEHARLGKRCGELEETVKIGEQECEEAHQEREEIYGQTVQLQEKVRVCECV